MDIGMIILRLLHIVAGAIWVGIAVFGAFLLGPAVQDSGPEGGKVMGALMKRGMMVVMPVLAITTILSGGMLFGKVSAGFNGAYMSSPSGMMFGTGGALGILAFVLGLTITRPTMVKINAIMTALPNTPPGEREQRMQEVAALRSRASAASKFLALMLVAAVAAMAIGRYV